MQIALRVNSTVYEQVRTRTPIARHVSKGEEKAISKANAVHSYSN